MKLKKVLLLAFESWYKYQWLSIIRAFKYLAELAGHVSLDEPLDWEILDPLAQRLKVTNSYCLSRVLCEDVLC